MIQLATYLLARGGLAALQAIPFEWALAAGRAAGRLIYLLDAPHRRRTVDHLRLAYGARLSPERARRLARQAFEYIGRHVAEVVHSPRRADVGLRIEGADVMRSSLADGRGVIAVSAHLGSYGLLARVVRPLGLRACVIVKRQKNLRVLDWGRRYLDRHFGVDVVVKSEARDRIPEILRSGAALLLVADQHPSTGGVPAVFFGRPIQAVAGPAIYAKRTGAPMVLVTIARHDDGLHRARFEGPLSADGSVEEITQRWVSALEARIREHPEQWMWMHRRWRSAGGNSKLPEGDGGDG